MLTEYKYPKLLIFYINNQLCASIFVYDLLLKLSTHLFMLCCVFASFVIEEGSACPNALILFNNIMITSDDGSQFISLAA